MTKKEKRIICKKCGENWLPSELPSNKEWTKIAPMPDSEGRITIMVMATWTCPKCGKSVMGLKGKYKDEGTTGPSKKELLITKLKNIDEKIALNELANEFGFSVENIKKALQIFIKEKAVAGRIEDDYYFKN